MPMLRKMVVSLYGLGGIAAIWLMVIFFSANTHLSWEWRVDYVVATFIPMAVLMLAVFLTQLKGSKVFWSLVVIVVAASLSLLYSLLLHAFPEKSQVVAVVHLAVVIVALGWMLLFIPRRGVQR